MKINLQKELNTKAKQFSPRKTARITYQQPAHSGKGEQIVFVQPRKN